MAAPKGNKFAAKAKEWEGALKRALARKHGGDWRAGLDKIAEATIDLAEAKERWAIEEIGSRIDGKPAQAIEHSGEIAHRRADELPDDVLAGIATGSSAGAADAASGEEIPSRPH